MPPNYYLISNIRKYALLSAGHANKLTIAIVIISLSVLSILVTSFSFLLCLYIYTHNNTHILWPLVLCILCTLALKRPRSYTVATHAATL